MQLVAQATAQAVAAGASEESVEVLNVSDTPLAYLAGNMARVQVQGLSHATLLSLVEGHVNVLVSAGIRERWRRVL